MAASTPAARAPRTSFLSAASACCRSRRHRELRAGARRPRPDRARGPRARCTGAAVPPAVGVGAAQAATPPNPSWDRRGGWGVLAGPWESLHLSVSSEDFNWSRGPSAGARVRPRALGAPWRFLPREGRRLAVTPGSLPASSVHEELRGSPVPDTEESVSRPGERGGEQGKPAPV